MPYGDHPASSRLASGLTPHEELPSLSSSSCSKRRSTGMPHWWWWRICQAIPPQDASQSTCEDGHQTSWRRSGDIPRQGRTTKGFATWGCAVERWRLLLNKTLYILWWSLLYSAIQNGLALLGSSCSLSPGIRCQCGEMLGWPPTLLFLQPCTTSASWEIFFLHTPRVHCNLCILFNTDLFWILWDEMHEMFSPPHVIQIFVWDAWCTMYFL